MKNKNEEIGPMLLKIKYSVTVPLQYLSFPGKLSILGNLAVVTATSLYYAQE